MDLRKIRRLIDLMIETGVNEIEIMENDEVIRVARGPTSYTTTTTTPVAEAPTTTVPTTTGAVTGAAPAAHETAPAPAATPSPRSRTVRAPMAGTFYCAPSPDAEPFVRVGDQVQPGDTLCIIESMKMMNRINADGAGRIEAILVDNAQVIELDQPLFTIA